MLEQNRYQQVPGLKALSCELDRLLSFGISAYINEALHACRIPQPFGIRGGTCVNRGLNWRYTHVKIAEEAFAADGGKRSERGSLTEKEWKGTGRQNEDAYRTKDSGKKQYWKACVRCAVGTVTGYMDLRTGDEIKPIFDMDFGCDQRAYAGCRDPALWPQDKCSV